MNAQTEYKPSEDILPVHENDSREQLLTLCGNWMDTAAMHARNEAYWRERALKAEGKTDAEIADWGH